MVFKFCVVAGRITIQMPVLEDPVDTIDNKPQCRDIKNPGQRCSTAEHYYRAICGHYSFLVPPDLAVARRSAKSTDCYL